MSVGSYLQKISLPSLMSGPFPLFSLSNFMVSSLMFKWSLLFEWILVERVRKGSNFIQLHVDIIHWTDSPSPIISWPKKCELTSGIYSVPLVYMSFVLYQYDSVLLWPCIKLRSDSMMSLMCSFCLRFHWLLIICILPS